MLDHFIFGFFLMLSVLLFPMPISVAVKRVEYGIFNPFHILWVASTISWILVLVLVL